MVYTLTAGLLCLTGPYETCERLETMEEAIILITVEGLETMDEAIILITVEGLRKAVTVLRVALFGCGHS